MDVTALLVFVGGFAVCAALVLLISVFGVKEQTFEEALEAQRKKNEKEKNKAKDKKKDDTKKKNQRRPKKREREDLIAETNVDENTEEEPCIVEAAEEVVMEEAPAPLVEESTPEPSPQPTPEPKESKPTRKEKKNKKMEIQEVVEELIEVAEVVAPVAEEPVVETVEEPEVVEEEAEEPVKIEPPVVEPVKVEAPKPSPVVAKKTGKKQSQNAAKFQAKDLLTVVEKTVLNDFEAQQIIDVLLNKQSGNFSTGADDWVEQGKPSETTKLQKRIDEMEKALEEETAKGQSFKDKMTDLRRELNEEKSAKAAASRTIEELNHTRTQETNNLSTKLQQVQYEMTILQTQLNQQVQHSHQLELSTTHYQATIDSLNQQLEISNAAAVSASAASNDPNLLSELEQLRGLRDKYEVSIADFAAKNTSLQQQLSAKAEEAVQMSGEVNKVVTLQQQLEQVSSSQSQLNAEVARLQAENNRLSSLQTSSESALENMKHLEKEVLDMREKQQTREQEMVRLVDENERLSEQVASSVERPQADGQADDGEVNGVGETDLQERLDSLTSDYDKLVARQQVEEELQDKLSSLTMAYDKIVAKQKVEESIKAELEEKLKMVGSDYEKAVARQNVEESCKAEMEDKLNALTIKCDELVVKLNDEDSSKAELQKQLDSITADFNELVARQKLEDASQSELGDHKLEIEAHKTEIEALRSKAETSENEISDFKLNIEELKSKNNVLRSKNWKAMEALNTTEQKYAKLLAEKEAELSNQVRSSAQETVALMARLFPELPTSGSLDELEAAAKHQIQALSDPGDDLEKLESQVSHYKTVLAQTESMLTSLQSSVEAEEVEWRRKLESSNKELSELSRQNAALTAKNSSLEESMLLVKQAEEVTEDYVHFVKDQKEISEIMQAKLVELQSKLAGEEEEKRGLAVEKEILEGKLSSAQSLTEEVDRLSKELAVEQSERGRLMGAQDELVNKNMQLSQLLSTGQQALEKETSAVKTLQKQLTKAKDDSD